MMFDVYIHFIDDYCVLECYKHITNNQLIPETMVHRIDHIIATHSHHFDRSCCWMTQLVGLNAGPKAFSAPKAHI